VAKQNHALIDAVLSSVTPTKSYSKLPQFTSIHHKLKKENNSDKHWTTSLHTHQTW